MRSGFGRNNWTWQQKRSLFIFLLCNSLLLLLYFLLPTQSNTILEIDTPEIQKIVAKVELERKEDSLRKIPIKYPFNPNFITDYQAYLFSIDMETLDALRTYRESDKWINSLADFQKVTQWEDAEIMEIEAYLKFPDWVKTNKPSQSTLAHNNKEKPIQKDLNTASVEDLLIVPGVGEVLSTRIIEWRDRLNGFTDTLQLNHIYGLNDWTKSNLSLYFYINPAETLPKLNVNDVSASDLATIPGVNFDLARRIWEFQHLREGINDLEELINIEGMTRGKLELIALYLYVN